MTVRRARSRIAKRLRGAARTFRARRNRRRDTESPPNWRKGRRRVTATKVITYLAAAVLTLWVLRALVTVFFVGEPLDVWPNPDAACDDTPFSCGVMSGIVLTLFSLVVGSLVFLLRRLDRVRRPYIQRAKDSPRSMVPTAGSILGEVVGRDELCRVISSDLCDRESRRPHILIGGIGAGKTAVMVELTKLLAKTGAVPVPVRLRDATSALDFRALAKRRFVASAEGALLSSGEGEAVWRQLCREDRVVVLADGLEEALVEGTRQRDRDNLIRLAISEAKEHHLPLIIASRPDTPLAGTEAALVELEPLSEEASLAYLKDASDDGDERRLDWIVETAEVVEAPLYLQIARELQEQRLLRYTYPPDEEQHVDTRRSARVDLRLRLLETYTSALVRGHFHSRLPLTRKDREATVAHIAGLACIGLRDNSLHVRFSDLGGYDERTAPNGQAPLPAANQVVLDEVNRRLERLSRRLDVRLAAANAQSLGLVETHADGVRFPHSILQAYLGSRLFRPLLEDNAFMDAALDRPGREFLVALVMHVHAARAEPERVIRGELALPPAAAEGTIPWDGLRQRLEQAADDCTSRTTALDLVAAALHIDAIAPTSRHDELTVMLQYHWLLVRGEERTVEETKLNAVARFGEVAQALLERQLPDQPPAYGMLFEIGGSEQSYPIRLAIAGVIAAGGDAAYDAVIRPPEPAAKKAKKTKTVVQRLTEELAERASATGLDQERAHRRLVMKAWLAPMLVSSSSKRVSSAHDVLDAWLELVGEAGSRRPSKRLPLSLEIALAQGFKHAANRRMEHPQARPERSEHLSDRARDMLRKTNYWYTRLTLVHALCLWALPERDEPMGARTPSPGRTPDADALVAHWLETQAGTREHPFVAEACRLAARALETRLPERYIWIDESGVVRRVGSRRETADTRRVHNLWIPPSTGWSALDARAQQLVADVLILISLAERGESPVDRDRRLERARRTDLPPCLVDDRQYLDPERTVGRVDRSPPGSNCKDGCPFDLCPYPPKGAVAYRVELSEAFCRRQQNLLRRRAVRGTTAPWQQSLPKELRAFWARMEDRARV